MNKKTIFVLTIFFILIFHQYVWAQGREDDVLTRIPGEMQRADFWISKLVNPDKVIMNSGEITVFNEQIRKALPKVVINLSKYPSSLTDNQLKEIIDNIPFPTEDRYLNGQKVTQDYYTKLKNQMNLSDIKRKNKILYALTVKRTNMRVLPTNDVSLTEPDDLEFDMFQDNALEGAEPILILHQSEDRQWCLVQSYNCRGWVKTDDLAIAKNKKEWLEYLNAKEFLVVTGNYLKLGFNPYTPEISELELGMGCKLPLVREKEIPCLVDNQSTLGNYVVKIPTRNSKGELAIKLALIPVNSDVSLGYLPYTRANILKQAFKVQGQRYGWGGMFNSRDCSSFVMDVYRSFGILLPRNSEQQRDSAGKTLQLASTLTPMEREALIGKELLPGATLHMNGHVMLYLGQHKGISYAIHDLAAYGNSNFKNYDGTLKRVPANQVMVTDLFLLRRNGHSFISSLVAGKQVEQ